jgi:D-glycero-alpha-D-manno-heptose 1-phosphate guanylyltransferase
VAQSVFLSRDNPPAVILCGGLGTRLSGVLGYCPKVLANVAGRPFLSHLLDQLVEGGWKDVILATGHLGSQVSEMFRDHYRGMGLHYSRETSPLGTAGALRLAAQTHSAVLVLNGDSYCNVDLARVVREHFDSRATNSIVGVRVDDVRRFGALEVDSDNMITAFGEKAQIDSDTPVPGLINAGIYVISCELIASIPPDRQVSLEHDVFPKWTNKGLRVTLGQGTFIDIGTPASLVQAQTFFPKADERAQGN